MGFPPEVVMQGMDLWLPVAAPHLARRKVGPSAKLASPTAGAFLGGEERI